MPRKNKNPFKRFIGLLNETNDLSKSKPKTKEGLEKQIKYIEGDFIKKILKGVEKLDEEGILRPFGKTLKGKSPIKNYMASELNNLTDDEKHRAIRAKLYETRGKQMIRFTKPDLNAFEQNTKLTPKQIQHLTGIATRGDSYLNQIVNGNIKVSKTLRDLAADYLKYPNSNIQDIMNNIMNTNINKVANNIVFNATMAAMGNGLVLWEMFIQTFNQSDSNIMSRNSLFTFATYGSKPPKPVGNPYIAVTQEINGLSQPALTFFRNNQQGLYDEWNDFVANL